MDISVFCFFSLLAVLLQAGQAVGSSQKVTFQFTDKYDDKVTDNNAFVNKIKPQIAGLMSVVESRLSQFRVSKKDFSIGVAFILLSGKNYQRPSETATASLRHLVKNGSPNIQGLDEVVLNVDRDSFASEKLKSSNPTATSGYGGMPMEGIIALAIMAAVVIVLFIICLVCTRSSNCCNNSPETYSRRSAPNLTKATAWHNKYDQENRGDFVFLYDDPPQTRKGNIKHLDRNPTSQTTSEEEQHDNLPPVNPDADYHIWDRSMDEIKSTEPGKVIINDSNEQKVDPRLLQLLVAGKLTLSRRTSGTGHNVIDSTGNINHSMEESVESSEIGILINQPGRPDNKIISAKTRGLDKAPPYVASQATFLKHKRKHVMAAEYASQDSDSTGYRNKLPPFLHAQYQHYHKSGSQTSSNEQIWIPRMQRRRPSTPTEHIFEKGKVVKQQRRLKSKQKQRADLKRPGIIQDAIWEEKNDKRESVEHIHQPQTLSTTIPGESFPSEDFKTSTALKPIYVNSFVATESYVAEGEDDHQSSASYHMSQVEEVHIEQNPYPFPADVQEEEVDENPVPYSADVDYDDVNNTDGKTGRGLSSSYHQTVGHESMFVYPTLHNSTSELGENSQISAPHYIPIVEDAAPVDSIEPVQSSSKAGSRRSQSNRSSGVPSGTGRPKSNHEGSDVNQPQRQSLRSSTAPSLNKLTTTQEENPETSGYIPPAPPFLLIPTHPVTVNDEAASHRSQASGEPLWDPNYYGASRPVSGASYTNEGFTENHTERLSQPGETTNLTRSISSSPVVTPSGDTEFSHPHHIILGLPDGDGVQRSSIAQVIGENGRVLGGRGDGVGHIAGEVSSPISQMDLAY